MEETIVWGVLCRKPYMEEGEGDKYSPTDLNAKQLPKVIGEQYLI